MFELLDELPFRDIYLSTDTSVGPRFNPIRGPSTAHFKKNAAVPEQFHGTMAKLLELGQSSEIGRVDFALQLTTMRVRVVRTNSFDGFQEYCFRKNPSIIPTFLELRHSEQFVEEAWSWANRTGLVLLAGPTGSGKTTTIMSILNEWCDDPGMVILTIEDPVEFRLRKAGLNFKTIQWEVKSDDEWPKYVRNCLRYAPTAILCGEIRTPETAEAVLNLANSGHLVLASVHGGTVMSAIGRLLSLASNSGLGGAAGESLADCFVSAACQKIVNGRPAVDFLPTLRTPGVDPCREFIRKGDLKMLDGIMSRLKAQRDNEEKLRNPIIAPRNSGNR
jgi:twitching motility protein PilT